MNPYAFFKYVPSGLHTSPLRLHPKCEAPQRIDEPHLQNKSLLTRLLPTESVTADRPGGSRRGGGWEWGMEVEGRCVERAWRRRDDNKVSTTAPPLPTDVMQPDV